MIKNFVLETANAPGTATTINLAGAVAGRRSFASSFTTGTVVFYVMDDGTLSEAGYGVLTIASPNTLARSTVLYDSTNGETTPSRRNFTGSTRVYCEIPASRICYIDNNNVHQPAPIEYDVNGAAATERTVVFKTGGVKRWDVTATSDAESGGNAGSNLSIRAYDDSGTLLGSNFTMNRPDGEVTFPGRVNFGSTGAGFTTLPNGKMIQWGAVTGAAAGATSNFPTPFLAATTPTVIPAPFNANFNVWYSSSNAAGFSWATNSTGTITFTYVALGNAP